MIKHCTTLLMAVGLALVLGHTARAADGVDHAMAQAPQAPMRDARQTGDSCDRPARISAAPSAAAKAARRSDLLSGAPFDPQIGRLFRDNTGA